MKVADLKAKKRASGIDIDSLGMNKKPSIDLDAKRRSYTEEDPLPEPTPEISLDLDDILLNSGSNDNDDNDSNKAEEVDKKLEDTPVVASPPTKKVREEDESIRLKREEARKVRECASVLYHIFIICNRLLRNICSGSKLN